MQRHPSTTSQKRRKTLHCPQQIFLSHLDDIKNIDESSTDIYNIKESSYKTKEDKKNNFLHVQTNFDDIITINQHSDLLKVAELEETNLCPSITLNESFLKLPTEPKNISDNVLKLPTEQKPLHKLYGSTKHLFRQRSMDVCSEETPFIQVSEDTDRSEPITNIELKIHDSQESVQRIISERRKLDENLKEINEFDIFERTDLNDSDSNSAQVECVVIQDNTVSDIEVVIEEDVC